MSWATIYTKGGAILSTAPISSSAFTPSSSQWRQESVNLNNYIGQADVRFMFVSTSNYGNNLYIDDVNILNTTGIQENTSSLLMNVYPNPGDGQFFIETNDKTNLAIISVYNTLGELVFSQKESQPGEKYAVDLSGQPSGTYLIRVNQGTSTVVRRVIIVH